MKIAYFGYDFFFPCLEDLINQGHTIQKIFSFPCDNVYNFNERVAKTAQKLGCPFTIDKVTSKDINDLQNSDCELIIVAAYQYKIPTKSLTIPAINIHPTLLPEGRGPWPLPWIILKGLKQSGVTIHKITEEMDSGDILLQKEFKVTNEDNLETISAKSQLLAKKMLSETLYNFHSYWKKARPQSKKFSYWGMPKPEDRALNWTKTGKELIKIVRAFGKFDSLAKFDGKEWVVQDANFWKEKHKLKPGTAVNRMSKEIIIAVKDGFICLRSYKIDPDFKW